LTKDLLCDIIINTETIRLIEKEKDHLTNDFVCVIIMSRTSIRLIE